MSLSEGFIGRVTLKINIFWTQMIRMVLNQKNIYVFENAPLFIFSSPTFTSLHP